MKVEEALKQLEPMLELADQYNKKADAAEHEAKILRERALEIMKSHDRVAEKLTDGIS